MTGDALGPVLLAIVVIGLSGLAWCEWRALIDALRDIARAIREGKR